MAPNSEEDSQIPFSNRRSWGVESQDKEPLRPPVYNPEDYAVSLKKWGKKGCFGTTTPQYLSQSTGSLEKLSEEFSLKKKRQSSPSTKSSSSIKSGDERESKKDKELTLKVEKKDLKNKENINRGLKNDLQKDFINPVLNLSTQSGEMSLRQFSTVTELLSKLKVDLKLSFLSFVQEFVGDPIDGVTLLLELLRCVQLTQTSQHQRCPPQIVRRALLDEHSCLVCLKHCLRCQDASRRLASSPAGLFTLAVSIMSNVTQSRTIALELLIKACEPQAGGHRAVSEALSTLRLRFGEPVRFRFLVGMLSSAGAVELLTTAMKFINAFVNSAPNLQQKVYIQAELEQAGFNCDTLRKTLPSNSESVKAELNKWEKNYFDVEKLHNKIAEVNVLQEKVHFLEKRIKILQEEKGILQSLEQCLKERCSELEEVKANESAKNSPKKSYRSCNITQIKKTADKDESTPAEDEGISSSEQELSQDEDYVKKASSYSNPNDLEKVTPPKKIKSDKSGSDTNRYLSKTHSIKITSTCNMKNLRNINKMKETNVDDGTEIIPLNGEDEEEGETTIDEVIEELENIVNDAETETRAGNERIRNLNLRSTPTFAAREGTFQIRRSFSSQERINFEESEIIPAILHPQPPKRAKSLVHIYFPGSELDSHSCNKNEFFEGSESENSDSLLTTTREEKSSPKSCRRFPKICESFDSYSSANTRTLFINQEQDFEDTELNSKPNYEERNIDEEEIKRKRLGNLHLNIQFPAVTLRSKILPKDTEKVQNDETRGKKISGFGSNNKMDAFQALGNHSTQKLLTESPFPRTPKLAPTPVKRSQTFHISSSDGESFHKANEVKPKPKMGVRGLDFQRSSEQKIKLDNWTYQVLNHKQNFDLRTEANERYLKRAVKEFPKGQNTEVDEGFPSSGRESSCNRFSIVQTNRGNDAIENAIPKTSLTGLDKITSAGRSKDIEKIDKGLDSLVDIVISSEKTKKSKLKHEWNADITKNIGPRTRRSLAESSLFYSQHTKTFNEPETSPKPPKPAERTSLTRNNSSTTPLHLPVEIKLTPPNSSSCNTDLKPAKSVDSLLLQKKRCPPEGSSSPRIFNKNQKNQKFLEEKSSLHSTPLKSNKIHTFFGNPKFSANSCNDQNANQNYFERHSASEENEKPVTSQTLNIPNAAQENLKSETISSNAPKITSNGYKKLGTKDNQIESKPNFLLGTYQSQPPRLLNSKAKISSVLQSINSFSVNSFADKSSENNSTFSRAKKNIADIISSKQSKNNSSHAKVTDSPSGLY